MFGFGKKEKEAPQQPQPHRPVQPVYRPPTLEQKYGVGARSTLATGANLLGLFGGEELDYVFARYASDHSRALFQIRDDLSRFMSQEKDLQEAREAAFLWEGRYRDLLDEHRAILKRFDMLLKNLNQPQSVIDNITNKIKEDVEKKYQSR